MDDQTRWNPEQAPRDPAVEQPANSVGYTFEQPPMPTPRRRRAPLTVVSSVLALAVIGLAIALLLVSHAKDQQVASAKATVVAQQDTIDQLQATVTAQ